MKFVLCMLFAVFVFFFAGCHDDNRAGSGISMGYTDVGGGQDTGGGVDVGTSHPDASVDTFPDVSEDDVEPDVAEEPQGLPIQWVGDTIVTYDFETGEVLSEKPFSFPQEVIDQVPLFFYFGVWCDNWIQEENWYSDGIEFPFDDQRYMEMDIRIPDDVLAVTDYCYVYLNLVCESNFGKGGSSCWQAMPRAPIEFPVDKPLVIRNGQVTYRIDGQTHDAVVDDTHWFGEDTWHYRPGFYMPALHE